MKMQVGMGRMGANMAQRLIKGDGPIVYNRTREKTVQIQREGAKAASTLDTL